MQTTNQAEPPTREDFENAVEEQKELIFETRYELRWFIRGLWAFGLSIVVSVVFFTISAFFPIVEGIAGIAVVVVAVLSAIGLFAGSITSYSFIRSHQEALRKRKRTLEKLQRNLAYFDEQALRHLTPEQYMHQLPKLITSSRKQADRYRNRFVAIQVVTILLSAAITSLSGGWLDRYFSLPWIIPVLSAIISILTSFTLFFKFREKGVNLRQTANAMDWEHMACTLGIGQYEGKSREDALCLLAKTGEVLCKEQQQRQVQLEQSSHEEQKALQAST